MLPVDSPINQEGAALVRKLLEAQIVQAFQRGVHGDFTVRLTVRDGIFQEAGRNVDQRERLSRAATSGC